MGYMLSLVHRCSSKRGFNNTWQHQSPAPGKRQMRLYGPDLTLRWMSPRHPALFAETAGTAACCQSLTANRRAIQSQHRGSRVAACVGVSDYWSSKEQHKGSPPALSLVCWCPSTLPTSLCFAVDHDRETEPSPALQSLCSSRVGREVVG